MKVIEGDKTIFIDCDQTLVLWPIFCRENGLQAELIEKGIRLGVNEGESTSYLKVLPNTSAIEFIKGLKAQGCKLIVWSHGGYRWAEAVVWALGLENIVEAVMCKPTLMLDDKPVSDLGETTMPSYPKGAGK